ncbi:MAG: hypothetical protein J3K34DRAFT_506752 [Monoraphidium minutum]|nr:MAG: hypothetical protein J3K34DRAFT_506752 [Monoraphidium minutum]
MVGSGGGSELLRGTAAAGAAGPAWRLLETPRVMGVGAGVFLLGFFLVMSIVVCLVGSRTRKPGLVYAVSVVLYGVVAAVLLGSPKGHKPPPAPEGYDRTLIPLVLTGALVCAGAAAGAAGLLVFHVRQPVYARPLSYHRDVLRQR